MDTALLLPDLPEAGHVAIFSFLAPQDICEVAAACKVLAEAAADDYLHRDNCRMVARHFMADDVDTGLMLRQLRQRYGGYRPALKALMSHGFYGHFRGCEASNSAGYFCSVDSANTIALWRRPTLTPQFSGTIAIDWTHVILSDSTGASMPYSALPVVPTCSQWEELPATACPQYLVLQRPVIDESDRSANNAADRVATSTFPRSFVLERLSPCSVPADLTSPSAPSWLPAVLALVGLWRAPYGSHGEELLHVTVETPSAGFDDRVAASPVPRMRNMPALRDAIGLAPLPPPVAPADGASAAGGSGSGSGSEGSGGGEHGFPPARPRMSLFGRRVAAGPGRPTTKVAVDNEASSFWGQASVSGLPPQARGLPARLVARKVIGDPNVPSGQVSITVDLTPAGVLDAEEAAHPAVPVVEFDPLHGPRVVDLSARAPILSAHRGWGQINVVPSNWAPSHESGVMLVYGDGTFAFVWHDPSDFAHVTVFTRFDPAAHQAAEAAPAEAPGEAEALP